METTVRKSEAEGGRELEFKVMGGTVVMCVAVLAQLTRWAELDRVREGFVKEPVSVEEPVSPVSGVESVVREEPVARAVSIVREEPVARVELNGPGVEVPVSVARV